ncbi:MAG: glycosyltransferase family 2 protein [Bryobacterales bacterium]|nr:glycosyltransferase family 2 protein [Bryobacterales bacterium]
MENAVYWVALAGAALAFGAIFYVYIGYPLLMFVLSRIVRQAKLETGHYPKVTFLIAAYNEAESIERKLQETLALEYPPDKLEILVVSDGSSDGTDELVKSCQDSRVRLLRVEGRLGKTNAQNKGVEASTGEVIVFSDATAVYHKRALVHMMQHYADEKVGAVSGRYQYFDPNGVSPTGLGSMAFWNYENLIKLYQSQVGTLTGCSGCIYSVRRSCYVPLAADVCSDLVEPLRIVRNGYRVAFEPRALAYEATTKETKQEFKMRVRVATRGMRGILGSRLLNPAERPYIAFQLFSHKVMRWMVPVFMLLFFVCTFVLAFYEPLFANMVGFQVGFYGMSLLSLKLPLHRASKLLGLPLFFCTLNAAALVGMIEVIRGQKYTVWETVR